MPSTLALAQLTLSRFDTLTLTGTTVSVGSLAVPSFSTLHLGNATTANCPTIGDITNNGLLVFTNPQNQSYTYSGAISGSGAVTKSGAGTVTLTQANSYTGQTEIYEGELDIQNSSALGSATAGTEVFNGAVLGLQGGITVANESLHLYCIGAPTGGELRNISGNNTYAGPIVSGDGNITSDSGVFTVSGTVANSAVLTVGGWRHDDLR